MGQRTNGGILGVANIPTTSSAGGVWTLKEVALYKKAGLWPAAATFDLSVDNASVNKGGDFTVTLTTSGVSDGTLVPYTITGIASGDLSSGSLTGNITVTSNTGSVTFTTASSGGTSGNLTATVTCGGDTVTISFVEGDTYFKYVTALLHGDGTNAAQNNTFIDSSTNNFTITRNGDATQGTFTPFGDTWSNYFDGSGDYLQSVTGSSGSFGTGDFCAEAWIYPQNSSTMAIMGNLVNSGGGDAQWGVYMNTGSNYIQFQGWFTVFTTGAAPALNTWSHVAVCRSGTTLSLFLNGTRLATTTTSNNFSSTNDIRIGAEASGTSPFTGYISNARVVKGASVYTPSSTTLTTPTTPLTAISGTSFLTCQSNRIIDNSTNAFAITKNGDISVQKFSPFSPTAAYSTSGLGGSAYFDGSGDYLNSSITAIGTNNFTIGYWSYLTSHAGTNGEGGYFQTSSTAGGLSSTYTAGVVALRSASGGGRVLIVNVGGTNINTTYVPPLNEWYYTEIIRSSNSVSVYVNGSLVSTPTTVTADLTGTYLSVGGYYSTGYLMAGYISGFVVKNSAGTGAVPTTPPSATSTSICLNFTNGGIIDNAMMNDWVTVGNAQLSTSVKKYGSASLAFDGTGDYLVAPNNSIYALGAGDFTIEAWVYTSASATTQAICAKETTNTNTLLFLVSNSSGNKIGVNLSSDGSTYGLTLTGSTTLSTSSWYHVAVVRNGSSTNNIKLYVNGVQDGQGTFSGTIYNDTSSFTVGYRQPSSNLYFNGYIDDLRITKGLARYTTTFTPPTGAFQDR